MKKIFKKIKKSWWRLKLNYYRRQKLRWRKKEFYWVDIYFKKIEPKKPIAVSVVSSKIDVYSSIAGSYRVLEKCYEMKIESLDNF